MKRGFRALRMPRGRRSQEILGPSWKTRSKECSSSFWKSAQRSPGEVERNHCGPFSLSRVLWYSSEWVFSRPSDENKSSLRNGKVSDDGKSLPSMTESRLM